MIKILSFIVMTAILVGCANPNQKRNEQVATIASENLTSCLKSQANQGNKSQCAQNFYSALGAISNDDFGKLPALRMATALYALLVKVDRRQINESDARIQYMQITNDFQADFNSAKRRSIAENKAATLQQQQMFMNAQRLLSPPGSVINCYRNPGSSITTCY